MTWRASSSLAVVCALAASQAPKMQKDQGLGVLALPKRSKCEPWQGQSKVFSRLFHCTQGKVCSGECQHGLASTFQGRPAASAHGGRPCKPPAAPHVDDAAQVGADGAVCVLLLVLIAVHGHLQGRGSRGGGPCDRSEHCHE